MRSWLKEWWEERRHQRAVRAYYGDCPCCGHDWREHHPTEGCSECAYEIEHEEAGAPTEPCGAEAPGYRY